MLRLSPADCLIGDHFSCPKESFDYFLWFYPPTDPNGPGVIGPENENFYDLNWPPLWSFNRALWVSDSGPFAIDVFIRKS